MSERSLEVRRLGLVAYAEALALQKQLETEVISQRINNSVEELV